MIRRSFSPRWAKGRPSLNFARTRLSSRRATRQHGLLYPERSGQGCCHIRTRQGGCSRHFGARPVLWRRLHERSFAAYRDNDSDGRVPDHRRSRRQRCLPHFTIEPKFSELFMAYLLTRNSRIEEDLVDQLFNSSEKRLARTLLLLANFGKEGRPEAINHQGQSGNARRTDRHHALARQLLHEQVPQARLHQLQRKNRGPQFAC